MKPLSPLQQGMLFHGLVSPSSGVDIEQIVIRLKESFDVARFEQAWCDVIMRHPILRTQFQWQEVSEPQQVVLPSVQLPIVFWRYPKILL